MKKEKFIAWLRLNGAQILPTTNSYEIARFIARGQTCVVYEGRRGPNSNGFALECWNAFRCGKTLRMGDVQKPRDYLTKRKVMLRERDGNCCFFCGQPLGQDETIEHLVGRAKGGPDHDDNLALSHEACNKAAANLPLIEKIKIRERKLYGRP